MAALIPKEEPTFHPTYARLLCVSLNKSGISSERLLAGTGLAWQDLLESPRPVRFGEMVKLIRAAIKLSGNPHLGLDIAAEMPLSAHGQSGYAVVASSNVSQALDVFVRYSKLRSSAIEFVLTRRETHCQLQVRECIDLGEIRVPLLETVLLMTVQMIEAMLGRRLAQVEYAFPYPAPAWEALYVSRLGTGVRFGAACMEMYLPNGILAEPCVTSDAEAYAAARRDCELAMARRMDDHDILKRVRQRLEQANTYPNCETMAADLHMSARTLMRKLKQHGTSYQALLDEVRKEQAMWYLTHTSYSVESIAERLGYLDTSNFSRTFRRWCGASPNAYRHSAQPGNG